MAAGSVFEEGFELVADDWHARMHAGMHAQVHAGQRASGVEGLNG